MPKKTARRIIDSRSQSRAMNITGVTLTAPATGAVSAATAGDGLTYTAGVLDVGAGTLITVGADDVGITAGSTYQFVGTGAGTAAAWQNLSTLAGAGLTHAAGVLAVGAGNGLTVNADDVALTTPGTLTAATSNSASGNHTHAVTTGAASTLTVSTSNATGSSASLARADHLHTITSSADVTGQTTSLLASSTGNLKLYSGNIAQALASNATFASGFAGSGWRVDYGVTEAAKASAEFDNLTVRGRMRVYELLIQQIRATNGSVFVSSSSKVLTTSASTDPLWTVNGSQLTFNGVNATLTTTLYTITTSTSAEDGADRTHYHGFLVGDIIRAQQVEWDGSGFAGVIQSDLEVTTVTNLYSYTAARASSGTSAAAVGYDYVRLGNATDTTRQGSVYLTSDDSNAPFVDIVDGVRSHADWNTAGKIRARLGKLSGITDATWGTLSGYGLWSDNVYLTGSIYATDGIFNGTIYAGAGQIGGWSIGATALTAGSGANTVGVDSGGTNPAFYAGSATPGSAPFRVTQAGALTATSATITGAITASSGSLSGFLTIGSSGGIYQGTGTSGTPTTGLKIWNDSGVGRIGGYNSGNLQWYASTTGYFYSGAGTMRIGNDDIRLQLGTYDGDYDDYRFIRWVPTIDGSDTAISDFDYRAHVTAWANTATQDTVNLQMSSRVNAGDYDTREARTLVAANNWNGSALHYAELAVIQKDSGDNYLGVIRMIQNVLEVDLNSAPTGNPPTGYIWVWWESGATMKTRDSGGTTRSVTFS